ncbi:MAG TPA: helix-turn-helix domain-containing protein [Streptosporangiaceae bacterium]
MAQQPTAPTTAPAAAEAVQPMLSSRTNGVVRARLGAAVPRMIEVIRHGVAEYADPRRPDYQQRLADSVTYVVAQFIEHISQPDGSTADVTAEFRRIGSVAAREGRTLDPVQNALRLGARFAWQWLGEADAGLDRRELSRVGEAIFGYLDELAAACSSGYDQANAQADDKREAHRRRLLDALIAEPSPHPDLLASLASAADWVLPSRIAMVVLGERPLGPPPAAAERGSSRGAARGGPSFGADVLTGWERAEPLLVLPDPDGPGRAAAIDRALSGLSGLSGLLAAIGPAVPVGRAAQSLRWARQALALARRGVIATSGDGPVHCQQHLSTLLLLADEDLARMLRATRLGPLERLRPGQRDRLAETMLAWLQLGENAGEVARRVHVHPQTVRYRLRQIQDLFGDQLADPDRRFELQLALLARQLLQVAPRETRDRRVR